MNSWTEKKDKIANYYADLIAEHGHNPRSCDYGHPESQQKKFRVLSEIIKQEHHSILDVGCGFADYAGFLKERYPHLNYTGVDITPDFVQKVKENQLDLDVRKLDILSEDIESFDVVTANGIFYLLEKQAEDFMHQLIKRMFKISNSVVAFNSLSAWCEDQKAGEFYADPLKTVDYCRSISPWVTLRHDYHSRDFTIYMHKRQIG